MRLDPSNASFWENRAAVHLQMAEIQKQYTDADGDTAVDHLALAVADAQRATEVNPSYPRGFSRLGMAYMKQGEYRRPAPPSG